ncbi:hypothetical protein JHK87_006937 [Glycine soja]|nr:hypothetical protein JHK87_006937 [Glycine soja]
MKRRANVFSKFIVASLRDLLIDFRVGRGYNIVALLGDPPKVWSGGWIVVCLANSHFDVVDSGVALNSSNLKERCIDRFSHVLTIRNVRPARNSNNDNVKADVVDDDKGELEKSNILLMGPTMLGITSCIVFYRLIGSVMIVDSPKPFPQWDQIAKCPNNTCAQVVHSNAEISGNKLVPLAAKECLE